MLVLSSLDPLSSCLLSVLSVVQRSSVSGFFLAVFFLVRQFVLSLQPGAQGWRVSSGLQWLDVVLPLLAEGQWKSETFLVHFHSLSWFAIEALLPRKLGRAEGGVSSPLYQRISNCVLSSSDALLNN